MSYELVLTENRVEGGSTRDFGNNVFLSNLPPDCKVYAFYYGGAIGDEILEAKLRTLGEKTGKNLFVNRGGLNDPNYEDIVKRFEIKKLPVIVVTAIDGLASPPSGEFLTAFARLDNKELLSSTDRTVECVQELFVLFLQGKVAEAMSKARWTQRKELVGVLTNFFAAALKPIKDFILERDFSISVLTGKFELKKRGD